MNEDTRLDLVRPDLVERGRRLAPAQRAAIARAVAAWACHVSHAEPYLDASVQAWLATGRAGPCLNRDAIGSVIEWLDDACFDAQEQADGYDAQAMAWFSKARSVNAVLYALDGADPRAFYDTVYEAHAAMGECSQIEAIWARHEA
ncbi:hypothetical protein ACU81Q_15420 [Komagataeibacter melomenusus]